MAKVTGIALNPQRSKIVRDNLKIIVFDMQMKATEIGLKANLDKGKISSFVNDKRDFSDRVLDRLEPVVNNYIKAYECLLKAEAERIG